MRYYSDEFPSHSGIMYGYDDDYHVCKVNSDGKLRVISDPYLYQVSEGNLSGHSPFEKFAVNDDIDSAAEEDVWSVGGLYSWPAGATLMAVASSSAEDDPVKADTSAGTGIWSVRIYYLTTGFVEKTADVTLNGTSEVNIAETDIFRINRIRPLTMGTGLKAAGNIDIKARAPTATVYSRIATGFTKGRQLVYTVPVGKVLYVTSMHGSIGGTTAPKYGRFVLRSTWDNISLTRNSWMTAYAEFGVNSTYAHPGFEAPLKFPAGSDLIVSCKTVDNDCYTTASLRGWIETA